MCSHIVSSDKFFVFAFAVALLTWTMRTQAQGYSAVNLYTMNAPVGMAAPYANGGHTTFAGQVGGSAVFRDQVTGQYGDSNAILWSASGIPQNMNPTNLNGFSDSFITAVTGGQQVGYGVGSDGATSTNTNSHALIWTGTASTAIDLQPTNMPGFVGSRASDSDGTNQVGFLATGGNEVLYNAAVWSGTANSVVNLHPSNFSGYNISVATGVSGNQQVGVLEQAQGGSRKPMLWSGSAASAIDLTPTNLPGSFNLGFAAIGIGGGVEVGYGQNVLGQVTTHAILWRGTASSAVDLNPTGSGQTVAYETNGTWQVGYEGVPINNNSDTSHHAMVWKGTAASAIDLQTYLPATAYSSDAFSVDDMGDVFGVESDNSGNQIAVEWIPTAVPEPATGMLILVCCIGTLMRRRRRSVLVSTP